MHKGGALFINEYKILLQEIIRFIQRHNDGWGNQRVEATGIYFINSGQANVMDENRIWVMLSKCDCVGLGPISKAIVSIITNMLSKTFKGPRAIR